MKKTILTLALCLMLILPFGLLASAKSYEKMNLEEALTQEEIEHDLSGYKETDKQITIYLFRGYGCPHCQEFLEFLNSIIDEYGKYFKLESYETWYDQNNYTLMNEVASFLGQTASGVPFIIIGDNVFSGYASSYDEKIKTAITEEYNSSDRYDVMKEMEKAKKATAGMSEADKWLIIGVTGGLTILSAICIIWLSYKQNRILFNRICNLEAENKEIKKAIENIKPVNGEKEKEDKVKTEKKTKKSEK